MKSFPASLKKLYEMLHFISESADKCSFHHKEIVFIQLAVEEVLVNIIRHGYLDRNDGYIKIYCLPLNNSDLKVVIQDIGVPFNPIEELKKTKIDRTEKLIGGHGLSLLEQIMDQVDYEFVNGANILTLIKKKSERKI